MDESMPSLMWEGCAWRSSLIRERPRQLEPWLYLPGPGTILCQAWLIFSSMPFFWEILDSRVKVHGAST